MYKQPSEGTIRTNCHENVKLKQKEMCVAVILLKIGVWMKNVKIIYYCQLDQLFRKINNCLPV